MTATILWSIAGRIGAQPYLAISVNAGDDDTLGRIHEIISSRRPKPERNEIMGGNFEPCIFVVGAEIHIEKSKIPAIVKWIKKKIEAEFASTGVTVEFATAGVRS